MTGEHRHDRHIHIHIYTHTHTHTQIKTGDLISLLSILESRLINTINKNYESNKKEKEGTQ
jgi:hypothetical protein